MTDRAIARWTTALALAVLAGCSGDDGAPAPEGAFYDQDGALVRGTRRPGPLPSIVWVCASGMRYDAVFPGPGRPPSTPRLAALANKAAAFPDASSPAAWSMPVAAAMLDGILPARIGADRAFARKDLVFLERMLPEVLARLGYETAAFTGPSWVAGSSGFEQGFARVRSDFHAAEGTGDMEAVQAWLRARPRDRPFLLFLHADDAAAPFGPKEDRPGPAGETERARARETADEFAAHAKAHDGALPEGAGPTCLRAWLLDPPLHRALVAAIGLPRLASAALDEADAMAEAARKDGGAGGASAALWSLRTEVGNAYERGLARTDAALGALLERILDPSSDLAVPPDTVVIVHSDHGTALGERGAFGPGRWLYEEQVRVPLLVSAPGRLALGSTVRGACGPLDLYPTILDLLGMPLPADLDGRSLLGLAAPGGKGRPVVAQERRCSHAGGTHAEVEVVSVRTERAKWISSHDLVSGRLTEEVYDLAADSGETRNLLPPGDAAARAPIPPTLGDDFVAEVARARERVRGRQENVASLAGHGYAAAGADPRTCGP